MKVRGMRQGSTEIYHKLVEILEACASEGWMRVCRSQVAGDPVVRAKSTATGGDEVTIRLDETTVLLDINGSDAVEFDTNDPADQLILVETTKELCARTLELQVDRSDGKCYGWRCANEEIMISEPVFARRRPASRIWRRVR